LKEKKHMPEAKLDNGNRRKRSALRDNKKADCKI
jgi:hypothetical protein